MCVLHTMIISVALVTVAACSFAIPFQIYIFTLRVVVNFQRHKVGIGIPEIELQHLQNFICIAHSFLDYFIIKIHVQCAL